LDIVHRLNYKKSRRFRSRCASIFRKRSTLLGGLSRSSYSQSLSNIATFSVFRYAPEEWQSVRRNRTWCVLRRMSEHVECWYGAQWLGVAGSREFTRLGASFPGHIRRAGFRNVWLFKIFGRQQSTEYGNFVSEMFLAAAGIEDRILCLPPLGLVSMPTGCDNSCTQSRSQISVAQICNYCLQSFKWNIYFVRRFLSERLVIDSDELFSTIPVSLMCCSSWCPFRLVFQALSHQSVQPTFGQYRWLHIPVHKKLLFFDDCRPDALFCIHELSLETVVSAMIYAPCTAPGYEHRSEPSSGRSSKSAPRCGKV
jgi:hypothetical protein